MKRAIPPRRLQSLYDRIDTCVRCASEGNTLRHVMGGGKFERPNFFFLFINPTHKNLSTNPAYAGARRYPFIGVRHLYKGLAEAGFGNVELINEIYERGWELEDEHRIEETLRKNDVYMSNFVKCAQPHPKNPKKQLMREAFSLLAEELEIVQPKYIVTFGLLPLEVITGKSHKMRDILRTVEEGTYNPLTSLPLNGKQYEVLPCFYPLGHGNPPKAHAILKHIKSHFV